MFRDRTEAGKKLAGKLAAYRGEQAVVLGLPRGGVVVAYEVARELRLPLDIIAVRKIGHPTNPEYAVGVVDARGTTIMNEAETSTIDARWLAREIAREQEEAERRARVYRGASKPLSLKGKIVILVDDGIATGLTMRLAVRSAREQGARKVIVAVPVAPADAIHALTKEGADELIVLEPPEEFMGAVGSHYARFDQVEDERVIKLLKERHEGTYAVGN
ncbi:phosphoribosyl transferase [Candidatus Kaiserbacteria bacterium]|nr:phosphoribosyl transferase [Candidatus Kaiserbacteria bacterium]